ncbi:hypothetical protein D3C80_965020 [compost metagenome]
MSSAANPLQEGGNRARRGDLADQVDIADINAKLQRCGRDQHLELAALEPLLRIQAQRFGQAAMVCGNRLLAQPVAEVAGDTFGQAPGIDEYQRGAVFTGKGGQAVIHQAPDISGHHRPQRYRRHFDGQVTLAGMADIDNGAGAPATHQKLCHPFDRALGSGQADTPQWLFAQGLQAFQGQGQMGATLVTGQGMDFVDDYRVHMGQAFTARSRAHQHVKRFGGRHQNVRGQLAHGGAFLLRCIAGAYRRGDAWGVQALLCNGLADAFERGLQVQTNVIGQGLQR